MSIYSSVVPPLLLLVSLNIFTNAMIAKSGNPEEKYALKFLQNFVESYENQTGGGVLSHADAMEKSFTRALRSNLEIMSTWDMVEETCDKISKLYSDLLNRFLHAAERALRVGRLLNEAAVRRGCELVVPEKIVLASYLFAYKLMIHPVAMALRCDFEHAARFILDQVNNRPAVAAKSREMAIKCRASFSSSSNADEELHEQLVPAIKQRWPIPMDMEYIEKMFLDPQSCAFSVDELLEIFGMDITSSTADDDDDDYASENDHHPSSPSSSTASHDENTSPNIGGDKMMIDSPPKR